MNRLFDIHMHILPCVDDGAQDMEMSLDMLREAVREGIGTIVATGHSYAYAFDPHNPLRQYDALCRAARAADLPVRLLLGMEMYCNPEIVEQCIDRLKAGEFLTLNGTALVLTEFEANLTTVQEAAFCIEKILAAGYVPVVAHVERYPFADVPSVTRLREMGALFQINAYSIAEDRSAYLRDTVNELLRAQCVDFIGSDAHRSSGYRPPRVRKGLEHLYRNFEESYVNRIVFENATQWLLP